ncbi:MAG: TrgA family protein [Paracoccaceae bacterium]
MREKPTSAKAVAAICFAVTATVGAYMFLPVIAEARRGDWFLPANAVLGAYIGWRVMGRLAGRGYRRAFWAGIGTSIWLAFWSLAIFSSYEMIHRSLLKRYDTPTEAVGNIGVIAMEYLGLSMQLDVILTILGGGVVGGILAEFAGRRWG